VGRRGGGGVVSRRAGTAAVVAVPACVVGGENGVKWSDETGAAGAVCAGAGAGATGLGGAGCGRLLTGALGGARLPPTAELMNWDML
jgi:hypothetical protein